MKAAVGRRYGPPEVVTIADVPRPEPRDDEILVRVRAAAVGVVDGLARRGSAPTPSTSACPRTARWRRSLLM
ncbi:MAG: hypothetical protein ACRDOD_03950 [Streptosporangiaceae bacterium]